MNVSIHQCQNRYDYMHPDQMQWQVSLHVGDGEESYSVQEIFHEEQSIDGALPSQVAQLILLRAEHYLYNGRLPEIKAKVEWIMAHAMQVDNAYLYGQIANHQKQINGLQQRIIEED